MRATSSMFVQADAPMVVGETIDNESIILNHRTGMYFSTAGTGSLIWEGIEGGLSLGEISDRLQGACGIESDCADEAVLRFVEALRSYGLVTDGAGRPAAPALEVARALAFEPPRLEVHEDLADMLLLDPIHDVSDDGWPSAKVA